MKQAFPAKFRLRYKADFRALRHGKKFVCTSLRFNFIPNRQEHARLGFAVSRRYGKAVYRNRFKRKLRNVFRCHAVRRAGVDILVIPQLNHQAGLNINEDMLTGLNRILHSIMEGKV
ncbi:MAG: ribonuclease P protein component [Mariprofundaceae bacterium]